MRKFTDQPFDGVADIEDVVSAYRLLLARNPDASGFAHFRRLLERGISVDQLVQHFVESPEYEARRKRDDTPVAVDCGGYAVFVRPSERDFGWKIQHWKTWEPHIVKTLTGLLRPGGTLVDIGANVGVMAFAGARAVGPSGTVVAVEPNPENLQMLYAGAVHNGFSHVRILPYAASDRAAIFSLDGGTSNTYVTAPAAGKTFTQSIVLDEALGDLPALDVVKIDIEGHEPAALAGFRKTLRRHRPMLLMEYNPRCLKDVAGLDPRACLDDFFELAEDVRVIEHDGTIVPAATAAALWAHWQQRNREAVRTNLLPDGMLHFDLLARVRG